MSKRTIYFHEDDFCQIQLLPASNWGHCAQQLGELSEFAEAHRAPGGGWTEVYMRQDEPESIASLALQVDQLRNLLARSLEPFDRVDTGYGSRRDPCEHTRAWGATKTAQSSSPSRPAELFSTSGWAWAGRALQLSDPY